MKFLTLGILVVLAPSFASAACHSGQSTAEMISFNGEAPFHNFHGPHIKHDPNSQNRSRYDFKSFGARIELSALTNSEAIFKITSLGSADKYRTLQVGSSESVDYPDGTINIMLDLIDPDATSKNPPDWVQARFETCIN